MTTILSKIKDQQIKGRKSLAILIDPESSSTKQIAQLVRLAIDAHVDYFFVGGSTVDYTDMERVLTQLETLTEIPVIIFPGSPNQLSNKADALLYLSLISGRNPELLIGKQVESVAFLRKSSLEVIPTGYLLIDGGTQSTVAYVSNTQPIPHDGTDIALATSLAGQYLGLQLIYLEAGSGAKWPVSADMIRSIKNELSVPLIVGGGIRTPEKARTAVEAGADIIVVGNILEKDPNLIIDLSIAVHSTKTLQS